MNELTIRQRDLPAMPMEEVKQYVDIIGDAIDALKAKRNAAGHLNADKAVIDEMDAQIREYSAMKLKAEIELGKKTAEIPTIPREANLRPDACDERIGKRKQLAEIGIPNRMASDYERLARHESIVSDYIEEQMEKGETPTKSGAFKRIAQEMPKPKELKQMAEDKLKHLEGKDVITLEEVQEINHNREVIRTEENDEFYKAVMRSHDQLFMYTGHWADKTKRFWETASIRDRKDVAATLGSISECVCRLIDEAVKALDSKGVKQ